MHPSSFRWKIARYAAPTLNKRRRHLVPVLSTCFLILFCDAKIPLTIITALIYSFKKTHPTWKLELQFCHLKQKAKIIIWYEIVTFDISVDILIVGRLGGIIIEKCQYGGKIYTFCCQIQTAHIASYMWDCGSFMNSKSLVNCFIWNHQYFEKFAPKKIGMPSRILPYVYVHSSLYNRELEIHDWTSICL